MSQQKALVLFSGGQDSAIVLADALSRYSVVETVGFQYGQRHQIEIEAREQLRARYAGLNPDWARRLSQDHILDLTALGDISETSMTREIEIQSRTDGLPNSFVPGRNLMFLVFAAALGIRRGAQILAAGMCEADFSGYPDCRADVLDAQMQTIRTGMVCDLVLETPLMHKTKAASWHFAEEIGGTELVEIIRIESHTCYKGDRTTLHAWGYGCGVCPACKLRAQGWNTYRGEPSS